MVSGTYDLTAAGAITESGDLSIAGVTTLVAGGNDITLNRAGNNFQAAVIITSGRNVTLVDAGAIDLGASTVTGTYAVTATAGGDITDSGVLTITGAATFTAANGQSVYLDGANTFSNTVAFSSGGTLANVTIRDSNDFDLSALTLSGNLIATSTGGSITDSGALAITGVTTIDASSGNVTLNTTTNNFQGAVKIDGVNVTVVDAGAIDLGVSTVTGTYAVTATAGGDITDSGMLTITGAATFTAANGQSIYLDGANTFSNTVAFSSGGTLANVTIRDSNDFDLSALTLSGDLIATSTGGSITNSGALAITGVTTVDASSGNVTLNTTTNNFQGAVKIDGVNVTVVDAGAIDLGVSTVTGTYAVTATAGGDITDSGMLTITGAATFTAANGQSIYLDGANTFSNTVAFSSAGTLANVTISDSNDFDFAALALSGNLITTSMGGSITDSGALAISGTSLFTTSASNKNITLDITNNAFAGAVTLKHHGINRKCNGRWRYYAA